ncbi:AB17A protein, partial [Smithornis capensis]|nr:AB17A protein [Smithornis capensis]
MNGLSISQLCCLFCCPPCPSRIAAKLAFLPPEPTYAVVPEPEPVGSTSTGSLRGAAGRWKLHLKDRADFQYSQRELDNIEVFVTKSSRGNRVGCMYVRCVPGASPHSVSRWPRVAFGAGLGTAVLPCSEPGLIPAGRVVPVSPAEVPRGCCHCYLLLVCHARADLSWSSSLAEAPYLSLCSVIKEHFLVPFPKDVFFGGRKNGSVSVLVLTPLSPLFPTHPLGSIEKISKITSPVLIIHGTEDEVIDFSHGLALFERCPKAVEPLWVDGAGHNDIELYSQYLERLRKFISQELPSQRN